MKVRFLFDENLSPRLKVAVLRFNPAIDILRVGDPNTPLLGTLDPSVRTSAHDVFTLISGKHL